MTQLSNYNIINASESEIKRFNEFSTFMIKIILNSNYFLNNAVLIRTRRNKLLLVSFLFCLSLFYYLSQQDGAGFFGYKEVRTVRNVKKTEKRGFYFTYNSHYLVTFTIKKMLDLKN